MRCIRMCAARPARLAIFSFAASPYRLLPPPYKSDPNGMKCASSINNFCVRRKGAQLTATQNSAYMAFLPFTLVKIENAPYLIL